MVKDVQRDNRWCCVFLLRKNSRERRNEELWLWFNVPPDPPEAIHTLKWSLASSPSPSNLSVKTYTDLKILLFFFFGWLVVLFLSILVPVLPSEWPQPLSFWVTSLHFRQAYRGLCVICDGGLLLHVRCSSVIHMRVQIMGLLRRGGLGVVRFSGVFWHHVHSLPPSASVCSLIGPIRFGHYCDLLKLIILWKIHVEEGQVVNALSRQKNKWFIIVIKLSIDSLFTGFDCVNTRHHMI